MITLTFDEKLHATDPALANFTVTIGESELWWDVATFIAMEEQRGRNFEAFGDHACVTMWWLYPIAADQKVYVTNIAAVIWMMLRATRCEFTKLVDVSGNTSTANAATDGITGASVTMPTGR